MRGRAAIAVLVLATLGLAAHPGGATVFLAKDEALSLAFPGVDRIEERVFILTDEQKRLVQTMARAPLDTKLWTIHVGWRGGTVQGYAVIESHVVRTLPETCMVVVDPQGSAQRVEILAFHEPPEYLPTARWIEQFKGRALDGELKLNAGIHAITGATLSARAMTDSVRRALALVTVLVQPAPAGGQ